MYKIALFLGVIIIGSIFSGYTIGASAQENGTVEAVPYEQKSKEGIDVTFTVKSYFDTINYFEYKPEENLVVFEIHFDWSEQNLSRAIFVHEEVSFPKNFTDFLTPSYIGQVNGIDLFKSSIIVDDTSEEQRIVHFMLSRDQISFLKSEQAKEMGEQLPNVMEFELVASEKFKFPVIAFTKNEEFRVDLSWDPLIIEPDEQKQAIRCPDCKIPVSMIIMKIEEK